MTVYRTPTSAAPLPQSSAVFWSYLPITAVICAVMAGLSWLIWGLRYTVIGVAMTALPLGLILVLLGPCFRNRIWGTVMCTSIASVLILGNALKVALLHAPISISDVHSLRVLISTLSGAPLALAVGLLIGAAMLSALSIRPSPRSLKSLALATGCAALLIALGSWQHPLYERLLPVPAESRTMPNGEIVRIHAPRDQIGILQARGPLLFLFDDWRVLREDTRNVPNQHDIESLQLQSWAPGDFSASRNVHVVLLESIWDTSLLDRYQSDRDPLDPRFLALWEQAGKPYMLSPEMGGGTANAEFEVLCGFPAPRNSMAFVNLLRNASPCLPAVLSRMGYRSIASHAHHADNWNRVSAYGRAGFDHYRPIEAFDLDDMEGIFLADSSFFRQNLAFLDGQEHGRPVFNYLVTLSSHWGYLRNMQRRPDLVATYPDDAPMLHGYANAVAYTTRAFMDWTAGVLSRDPHALIVAFGDHAPSLDADPDPYTEVNGRDPATFDSPETRRRLGIARTPLLIINGERGPVHAGTDVPMYELPGLIGELLGSGALLPQSAQRGPMTIRPFRGHMLTGHDGIWQDCAEHPGAERMPVCDQAWTQFNQLRMLRQDTVLGHGHYLRAQGADDYRQVRRTAMEVEQRHQACAFEVEQWGPQEGTVSKGLNVQADGSSAIWIRMKSIRGEPEVKIDGMPGIPTRADGLITAAFPSDRLASRAGKLPVTLTCPDQIPVLIGNIDIQPAAPPNLTRCSFTVDQWGPRTGRVREGFNVQPDGSSGLWITMKNLRGTPEIRLGEATGTSHYAESLVTSGFNDPALFTQAAQLSVSIQCPGQAPMQLGLIEIGADA